jgi:hypothetical protein
MSNPREYVKIASTRDSFAFCPDCGAVVYDTALHDEFHKWVYPRDKGESWYDPKIDAIAPPEERAHITDGTACWCNPRVVHV